MPSRAAPLFETVRAAHVPSDITLLDRHGAPLQQLRIDATVRRGPWLALAEVSPALRHALVLSEDRRFFDHSGVDWQALAASAWANAWNQRTRGASTLTMQLAGLLDAELARPAGGRSVAVKVSQIVRARELEATWSKTQILEAYLNRVPLRGELVGVAAAAQQLFGKHASGLDAQEAAVLAVMVRAPNAGAAALERRACAVLQQMAPTSAPVSAPVSAVLSAALSASTSISASTSASTSASASASISASASASTQPSRCDGLATTIAQSLARRPGSAGGANLAPHLASLMAAPLAHSPARTALRAQTVLRSTLDAHTQRVALAALRRQLAELRGRNVEDGAVVVLDNASGEVLAWVGSSASTSAAAEVDAVLARRQPGSTLKPFVYALALQRRLITPASVLDDSPVQLAAGGALYQPQNYDQTFRGPVSVRTALASSLNVPTVRVAAMLGPEALFDSLNQSGLRLSESAGFHGHALALGSADVTLLDLSNAYRMLARQGLHSALRWQADAPAQPERRALPAAVAWQVADMLADPAARATTFGLDSPLVTRGWAAVKTGTSKDMRDNWCIGFSRHYTVGVWVGNAGGAPMHGVSGISGAAPVWRELMAHLHAGTPSTAPAPPAGLVLQAGEWFLAGTEPGRAVAPKVMPVFGIQSPRSGSVIVLDPEIPRAVQQLIFEGEPGQWFVDGRRVGSGSVVHWLPRPGRFVLERRSAEGTDRVVFEVRAAPPRRAVRGPNVAANLKPNG